MKQTPKGQLPKSVLKAAKAIRSHVFGRAADAEKIKERVQAVPGAKWEEWMQFHVFHSTDWGDGSPNAEGTVLSTNGTDMAWERAMMLATMLRAQEQEWAASGATGKVKTTYQVVYAIHHLSSDHVVAWLDVETGEVKTGAVWQAAEAKRLATENEVAA